MDSTQKSESDQCLLARFAKSRDERAFRDLVTRYLPLVIGSANRRLGNQDLAQDVTQKVFVLLAQKSASLQNHPTLSRWLYQSTKNIARKTIESDQRRRQREQLYMDSQELPQGVEKICWK